MKINFFLFCIFLLFGISLQQISFSERCNQRGVFVSIPSDANRTQNNITESLNQTLNDIDGICACTFGYYGLKCEITAEMREPGFWRFHRSFVLILNSFIFIGSSLLFHELRKRYQETKNLISRVDSNVGGALASNVKLYMTFCILMISLINLVDFSIDPSGFENIYKVYWVSEFFVSIQFPFFIAIYGLLLLHWIEIYSSSKKLFKRKTQLFAISLNKTEQMLDITIDEAIRYRNKLFTGTRLAFFFLVIFHLLLQIIYTIFWSYFRILLMLFLWGALIIFTYIILSVVFFIHGKRLLKIMPFDGDFRERIQRTSRMILIHALIVALTWTMILLGFGLPQDNAIFYILQDAGFRYSIAGSLLILLFFSFNWQPKFPFFTVSTHSSQTSGPEDTTQDGTSSPLQNTLHPTLEFVSNSDPFVIHSSHPSTV